MLFWRLAWSGALAAAFIASACAPPAYPGEQAQGEDRSTAAAPQKTLTIGIAGDLPDFYGFGGIRSGGVTNVPPIALDTLTVLTDRGEYQPLLAAEPLSVERGTWRVNADGTMDTVLKLRPGGQWH